METDIISIVSVISRLIPSGLVLVGFIILYNKTKVTSSLVMMISQGFGMLIQLGYSFVQFDFADKYDVATVSTVFGILRLISTLNHIIFGIFLILFASRYFKKQSVGKALDSF